MLVLSRKINESIIIDGNVIVEILGIQGRLVRVGITAPREVSVIRSELSVDRVTGKTEQVGRPVAGECAGEPQNSSFTAETSEKTLSSFLDRRRTWRTA